MLPYEVARQLNAAMAVVPHAATAVRWYERALSARVWWNDGDVFRLRVEENPVFVGSPRRTRDVVDEVPARVEVFVDDVDGLVERALAAGADGGTDPVRDHGAPWGIHRRGGFLDPFGLRWAVSDTSPLSWHGPGRSHHIGYVEAVIDGLTELGRTPPRLVDLSTDIGIDLVVLPAGEDPKRAVRITFDRPTADDAPRRGGANADRRVEKGGVGRGNAASWPNGCRCPTTCCRCGSTSPTRPVCLAR
jgi:PhnB protein